LHLVLVGCGNDAGEVSDDAQRQHLLRDGTAGLAADDGAGLEFLEVRVFRLLCFQVAAVGDALHVYLAKGVKGVKEVKEVKEGSRQAGKKKGQERK
jgi:hypothetical protein